MNAPWQSPWLQWSFNPPGLLAVLAAVAAYAWLTRNSRLSAQSLFTYLGGVFLVFVALASPFDTLGECCYLWAHMAQHEILLMIAPPMIVWGADLALQARQNPTPAPPSPSKGSGAGLSWLAVGVLLVNLYLWHLPGPYQAALVNKPLHAVQHGLYLFTGIFYWWRTIGAFRGAANLFTVVMGRLGYLTAMTVGMMPLGLILFMAPVPVYPHYVRMAELINSSPMFDQQFAGLIMLFGGSPSLAVPLMMGIRAGGFGSKKNSLNGEISNSPPADELLPKVEEAAYD